MKKSIIKTIGLTLAAGLAAASLAGCGAKINGNETALVVNGESMPLGEANFMLRYQQSQTYYYMQMMGMSGSNLWSGEMEEGQSYGEFFKNSTRDSLVELMAVKQKAVEEYEISLTEEQESQIADAAQQFMDANPEAGEDFGVSQEQVEDLLALYTYGNAVKPQLTGDVDRDISDDEAAQSTIVYIRLKKAEADAEDAEATNEAALADTEKLLEELLKEENADADTDAINELADTINEDFFAMQYSYGADDTSLDDSLKTAAASLKDGAFYPEVIDTDSYYYIVKLVAAFDREATDAKKESMITSRENEAIRAQFDEWREAAEVEEKKCWQELTVSDADVYTIAAESAASGN